MYNAPASTEKKREGEGADEYRLRNWLWDRALSGDILVEQNIHIIDLANWILGAHPVKATATGGRNVLTHFGDCWDHYEVIYTYPSDVRFSFSSTQFGGTGLFEAGLRLFGTEGMATYPYSGPCEIKGAQKWSWAESLKTEAGAGKFAADGAFSDNLADADSQKEKSFIASIVSGPVHNEIADGVQTALSCMLGRMAGLEKREVSWEELEAKGESYELGIPMEQFA
jgi:predicted dehydrogenase